MTSYSLIMTYKSYLLYFIAIILVSSCANKQESDLAFFDTEIAYTPVETVQIFTFEQIFQPRKMRMIGDLLFVADFQNNPAFHVLQINEGGELTYLHGEGSKGRGPGEFQLVEDFIETGSGIQIYDGGLLKLVEYDHSGMAVQTDDMHLKIKDRPITMNALPDGNYVAAGILFNDRFHIYDQQGELKGQYGKQLAFDEEFIPRHLGISWYSFSITHPEQYLVYLFSLNADFIEKYDSDGTLLKRVQGTEFPVPKKRIEVSNGTPWPVDNGGKYAYMWADRNDQFIYALYSGIIAAETEHPRGNKVHKFDWDLNLVGAYELDHYPAMITPDGSGGLYSLYNTDEGSEFRYQKLE